MKPLVKILSIILFLSTLVFAQRGDGPLGPPHGGGRGQGPGMKKIQELEKLKLIETLDMSEDVSVKFFTRRNQHMNEVKDLEDRIDNILDEMNDELKKDKDANQQKLKKLNEDFLSVSDDFHKTRINFIASLKDILTTEQISKYIVFDRNFREQMRDILMKQRMNRNNHDKN